MKQFLQEIGINIALIVAGFFGSLIMVSKKSTDNIKATLTSIGAGVASANYLTPLVIDLLKIEKQTYTLGIAFILGFLGLKGVEYVTSKILKNGNNKSNS